MPRFTDSAEQAQQTQTRRNQILDAAVKVFAAQGFHRSTVRDVAKAAELADGTIYLYFKSKDDLLLGIMDRLNESEHRKADLEKVAQSEINPNEALHDYSKHRLDMFSGDNLQVLQIVLSEVLVNAELRQRYYCEIMQPTYAIAEPILQQMIEAGVLRGKDGALISRAASAMTLGLLIQRILGDEVTLNRWDELQTLISELLLMERR